VEEIDAIRSVAGPGNPKLLKKGGPMAHPSLETASQHSDKPAHESSCKGDRDPETLPEDPRLPPAAQVTPPPRGGDGDGYEEK
jgi:hypothetical protein